MIILASVMSAVKCPQCERVAVEDYYCHTGELFLYCLRCGYTYSKTMSASEERMEYKEEISYGHGIYHLAHKDGQIKTIFLKSQLTEAELQKFKDEFLNENTDQEGSYLVTFNDKVFATQFGNLPEKFHLSFDEHKKQIIQRYGDVEYADLSLPIEE